MSCGCDGSKLVEGKAIVDHVKSKGKENYAPTIAHQINCDCGETFTLETVIMNCPKCEMTYAVTPCSSDDINNIKQAGIKYA
jgi:Zn finger protein HypA/HybF involved in hydrogenase expression